MLFEKKAMEELLCTLDEKGSIFPGFEIVKMNNQPKLLGTGGFSSVYEMRCPERPNNRYVLKVIGFDKHVVTSEDFWNTGQNNWRLHQPFKQVSLRKTILLQPKCYLS